MKPHIRLILFGILLLVTAFGFIACTPWARGISEFGAVIILAYHPKIVPVLVYERFNGFGLGAAQPVATLLILVAITSFSFLRFALASERKN
ncbi:MAG: hypothetical protein HYZ21_13960 [Chloroflexi bacterium]|nr:hypothetical protein [Chloroflexota bacterium]